MESEMRISGGPFTRQVQHNPVAPKNFSHLTRGDKTSKKVAAQEMKQLNRRKLTQSQEGGVTKCGGN
jgi:hypothetical protein